MGGFRLIRKLLSALMIICLLSGSVYSASMADDDDHFLPAKGFDFDFTLHLYPEAVSSLPREQVAGYADLLDSLRFEGSLVTAESEDNFELNLRVIPVQWPEGAVDIRLHGRQDPILLNSSLLGDQTIKLSTYSLLGFCSKMAEHLGIPLQYVGLAYPYSWLYGLKQPIDDWNFMMSKEEDGVIPDEWVEYLWSGWWWRLREYVPLKTLVEAIAKGTDAEEAFLAVVDEIPDYFGVDFAEKKAFRIRREQNQTTWENHKGEVFFRETRGESSGSTELSLPRMKTGYLPVFSVRTSGDSSWKTSMIYAGLLGRKDLPNLVDLKMSLISVPTSWPVNCHSLLNVDLTGTLFPNLGISCYLAGEQNGHAVIDIRKPTVDLELGDLILTIDGTFLPREGDVRIHEFWMWEEEREQQPLDLLISNDSNIMDFMPGVESSLISGLLKFLVGIPASSCQVIMDDLTSLGVFTLLLDE